MLNALTLLAATEMGGAVKRNVRAVCYYAVAAGAGVVGLFFLLLAGRDALLPQLGPVMANVAVGGGMLALALLIYLIGYVIRNRRSRTSPLASSAIVAAPFAAKMVGKRINLATLSVAGVMLAGAAIGHYLGRK